MNYQDYEVEDFLLNRSFRNYCLGANEEDRAFWEEWIVLHPEKYGVVLQAKQLYELLNGNNTVQNYRDDVKTFRARLEQHLAADRTSAEFASADPSPTDSASTIQSAAGSQGVETSSGKSWFQQKWYWLAAAAVLIPFLFFITGKVTHSVPEGKVPGEYARVSSAGERKSFQLPDGTKVMLNAGSIIHIFQDFNKQDRQITLEGEAFFDVTRDAQKPFVIHTSSMDVKVLGTTFNIKAYPEDKMTEAALLNGSVEIRVKKDNSRILLHPSEKILIPNITRNTTPTPEKNAPGPGKNYSLGKLIANPVDSSIAEVSWTENKLAFTDNSFEEIATGLERWYNVSIQFEDPSLKQFRFTGTFDKKTIEQVLNALAASRPFEYRLEPGNKIVIKNVDIKN
jgi:ferric-dicitrate binding protein FerR (iron transport regulator)